MQKPLAAFAAVAVSFGRLPSRTHLILALLAPAAACGGDPSPPAHATPQTADSAGVLIVSYERTPNRRRPLPARRRATVPPRRQPG